MDTEGSGATDLLQTHAGSVRAWILPELCFIKQSILPGSWAELQYLSLQKSWSVFSPPGLKEKKKKSRGQSINMKNIRAHFLLSHRQWGFESHRRERQVRGTGTARGLEEKGNRSELQGHTFRCWRTRVGGGPLIPRAEWQGQPHLFSPFLATASVARKSNLSSLIRVEQSEQWAPSSKLTAQLNGVEEPGRDVCFVCLELVPSNGSFPNSNCKTTSTGFFFASPEIFRSLRFLTQAHPAKVENLAPFQRWGCGWVSYIVRGWHGAVCVQLMCIHLLMFLFCVWLYWWY